MQKSYIHFLKPTLSTGRYDYFADPKRPLNNARLLSFETYMSDLSDFEKVFEILEKDFHKMVKFCKSLEGKKDPVKEMKDFIAKHSKKKKKPASASASAEFWKQHSRDRVFF